MTGLHGSPFLQPTTIRGIEVQEVAEWAGNTHFSSIHRSHSRILSLGSVLDNPINDGNFNESVARGKKRMVAKINKLRQIYSSRVKRLWNKNTQVQKTKHGLQEENNSENDFHINDPETITIGRYRSLINDYRLCVVNDSDECTSIISELQPMANLPSPISLSKTR